MQTNFAIYLAAMTLAKTMIAMDDLNKQIAAQQDVVSKANEKASNETDAAARITAQLTAKNEADNLTILLTAKSILENEQVVADRVVEANKSVVRSFGFLTHQTVKTGNIADSAASNKKSWFSRVF